MRKLYPFIIGGGLFFYFLDEIHVVDTSISFGNLTGSYTADATIGWVMGLGLIVMAVKLIIMVFNDPEEEEEEGEIKKTWWNDYYD